MAQAEFVLCSQHPPTKGKTETAKLLVESKADVNLKEKVFRMTGGGHQGPK